MLTARFSDAVEYARAHHEGDMRKGTTIPYVAHLLAVSALVLEHGGDETAAVAALLHDVVEDGGGRAALEEIRGRFGEEVAAIVEGCSDTTAAEKEDWALRKTRYLEHLQSASPQVLLVSAADKLHNARAILADLRVHGKSLWLRFNRGARDQLWYYESLRDAFRRRLPGPLSDELDRTVRDINRLLDLDDRVEWLDREFMLWSMEDSPARGAIVDWPGCPLVITQEPDGLAVHAEVGRGGDYCPDMDVDLAGLIDLPLLDEFRLEYREPEEVAWLVGRDRGNLREICHEVAALAWMTIAWQLSVSEAMLDMPATTFAERVEHGPWYSAPPMRSALHWTADAGKRWTTVGPTGTHWEIADHGHDGSRRYAITVAHWDHPDWWAPSLEAAQKLVAQLDARAPMPESEQVVERDVIVPEPGDEYVAYSTRKAPPDGPCKCGSIAPPAAVKPRRETTEWWDDPCAFWRCPDCGWHRGYVD